MKGFVFKILLPVALIAGGAYFGFRQITPEAVVESPTRGIAPKAVSGTIKVMAEHSELKSSVDGRIILSNLELGKTVKKDEVLIQLDTADIDLQIEGMKLDLEEVEELAKQESPYVVQLANAENRLEKAQADMEASDSAFISEQQLEVMKSQVAGSKAGLERDLKNKARSVSKTRNELRRLELQKSRMTLRSAIDGVVYKIEAYQGDLIGQSRPIAFIASLDTIVEARVSEESFADLKVGQVANVKFLGISDETFSAKIDTLIPVADEQSQRYSVLLDVNVEEGRLSPGLTGETLITVDERENALLIPKKAVNGDSIYVVESGLVKLRELKLGYGDLTKVEVLEGLSEEDRVIVEDLSMFRDGQRVRPVEAN